IRDRNVSGVQTCALPIFGVGDGIGIRAIAYTDAVGHPEVGEAVIVNVSALAKRLGTGGFGLIVALPDALPADPPPGPGHLVKDRSEERRVGRESPRRCDK